MTTDPDAARDGAVVPRAAHAAIFLLALAACAAIAPFAGLIGEGRWQEDEYRLFASLARWGFDAIPPRLAYSPEPLSEALLMGYGATVLALDRPLVGSLLALLWAATFGSVALAARAALPPGRGRSTVSVAIAGLLGARFLSTHKVTEMFYWPMAAAAYLPVLAAGGAASLLVSARTRRNDRLCGAAVLVAALTSEIGAAFAIAFAVAGAVIARVERRGATGGASRDTGTTVTFLVAPGLAGVAVIAAFLAHRAGMPERIASGQPFTGRPVASVVASVAELAHEAWGSVGECAGRLCLAVAIAALWRLGRGRDAPARHLACAAALLGAAFFSLVAAYDHYGYLCCERQDTLRGCFLDLASVLIGLAVAAFVDRRVVGPGGLVAVALLAGAASLSAIGARLPGLRDSYGIYHWAILSRARTWSSGRRPGDDGMVFYVPPDRPGEIVTGLGEATGPTIADRNGPGLIPAVGAFFDKRAVRVCEPWQTPRSWVIDGVFIPACPDP